MVSEEQYQRLVTKYNTLYKQYRDLEQKHIKKKEHVRKADEKYKAAKENARQWHEYIARHHLGTSALPLETHSRKAADGAHAVDDIARRVSTGTISLDDVTSSQTTEEDQSTTLLFGNEGLESEDEPQVVSARSVKRKRSNPAHVMPPPSLVKLEPTSPSDPIELPSGDYSSPVAKRQKPVRTEASDLDAFVEHMYTPRKLNRRRAMSNEPVRPMTLPSAVSALSDGDVAADLQLGVKVKPESNMDPQGSESDITARDIALLPGEKPTNDAALRPISVNIPSLPRKNSNLTYMKHNQRDRRVSEKLALLSEGGDDQARHQMDVPLNERTPKAHVSRRLDTLLNEPVQERQPLPPRRTPDAALLQRPARNPPSAGRALAATGTPAKAGKPGFRRPHGLETSPPPIRPEDEPLRTRPLKELHLGDFRVNPRYMDSNHAFAHTFRGREQRRCLQGCTKPECCGGAFRKAIEMGAIHDTKTDAQVFEEYLGPNFATLVGAHAPDKRKDLLVQARAHGLAKQHGKHRHAFERGSTPPGFWRTDMPNTQEEKEDHAKAHEMEMRKIEERWREAMREGGRWLFRDE